MYRLNGGLLGFKPLILSANLPCEFQTEITGINMDQLETACKPLC